MSKLNWTYAGLDGREEHATVERNGTTYRIRAVQDSDASNPFTDHDGNWPICVRSPDRFHSGTFKTYDKTGSGIDLEHPFAWFEDAVLVHMQRNIAAVFDAHNPNPGVDLILVETGTKYCRDIDELRRIFDEQMDCIGDSDRFDICVKLYALAGIAAYASQSSGYSQGDWCEVLVVATPKAIATFGNTPAADDLAATVDLYGAWAWGDVYGYIVERADMTAVDADDPDPDDIAWEEIEGGSCWGYYGSDHDKSGLEESALECLPAELEMAA